MGTWRFLGVGVVFSPTGKECCEWLDVGVWEVILKIKGSQKLDFVEYVKIKQGACQRRKRFGTGNPFYFTF